MRSRLANLESVINALKPYLGQYLEEHGIDTNNNFLCINPKHEDTDASMTNKQVPEQAYCFGCRQVADIFTAAHWLEGKPIKGIGWVEENVMYLAKKYNVPIELVDLTQEEIYEYRTYEAYKLASQLVSDRNFGDYTKADNEIERRGWDKEKCVTWGIGTVNYVEFKKTMKEAGFEPGFLDSVDLDRSNLLDNHNLIFTVYDDYGRPVGFSAKNLNYKKGDKSPKYINTKATGLECAIFKKGERLYGFDIAKETHGPLYIFEGQADVITARHYGLMNCCCTLGTAFTDHHVNLLKKHGAFNLIFTFDGDKAGDEALQKVIDVQLAKERDFRIKLIQLPPNKDPDEILRENGISDLMQMKKWTAFEWRMMKFVEEHEEESRSDDEDFDMREVAEKMIPIIVSEGSHLRQEEMAKQVAIMTGYNLTTILSEVKRLRNEKEAEIQTKKVNAIEALTYQIRQNPEDAELFLTECQTTIDNINKQAESTDIGKSCLSFLLNQKDFDEAKTGDFGGFFLAPDGLGIVGTRLSEDWKSDCLFFVGGSEQAGKCLKWDTKVLLASGEYATIEDVVKFRNDTHLVGMNKEHKLVPVKISQRIDSGELECFKVVTKQGLTTEPSITHPYYTLEGWKQVTELKKGDKIAIAKNYNCFNNLHSPISEDEAMLLAAFLSDGSITDSVGFSNTDNELISWFKETLCNKWNDLKFRDENNNVIYVSDPSNRNNRVKDWLKTHGLFGLNSYEKFIPDVIFKCSPKRIAKFLGMFWACDGWIYYNPKKSNKFEIGLTLVNYNMVKQIRSLLLRFGIKTKIIEKTIPYKDEQRIAYTLSIKDIENARKFYNNIKIPLEYKQQNLKALLDAEKKSISAYGDNFPVEIWNYVEEKLKEQNWTFNKLLTIMGENNNRINYDSQGDIYKIRPYWRPTANDRDNPGQKWLGVTPEKLRLIGYVLNDSFLISLAEGDIYFDEIVEIKPVGKHQCYDLEIKDEHNFIAEDTIVHNTTFCSQLAYEIAKDDRNNAICIYMSIDDTAKRILYKWLCRTADGVKLHLGHVENPNFYLKDPSNSWIKNYRELAYSNITELIKDERLVLKDATNGSSLTYAQSLVKSFRSRFPNKNIVLFIDNFHKLTDYGNIQGHERTKRLCNHLKNLTTTEHVTVIATAEYTKLAHGEKPSNSSFAESRALQYDADVLIHLYNDMHINDENAILVHEHEGELYPRIWCKFGKNKITGFEGRLFLDLFPAAATMRGVATEQAIQDQKARKEFLDKNKLSKF